MAAVAILARAMTELAEEVQSRIERTEMGPDSGRLRSAWRQPGRSSGRRTPTRSSSSTPLRRRINCHW